MARFVPQEDAGSFATQQPCDLCGNVFQQRRRVIVLDELACNGQQRFKALLPFAPFIPRLSLLQRDAEVMSRGDGVFDTLKAVSKLVLKTLS